MTRMFTDGMSSVYKPDRNLRAKEARKQQRAEIARKAVEEIHRSGPLLISELALRIGESVPKVSYAIAEVPLILCRKKRSDYKTIICPVESAKPQPPIDNAKYKKMAAQIVAQNVRRGKS